MAKIILRLLVIFGLCSTFHFSLPAQAPEINAPTSTPISSKTSQAFKGEPEWPAR